ncbi:hypothetical protein VTN02DRAFT_2913 [Thermoascus thermophilus]
MMELRMNQAPLGPDSCGPCPLWHRCRPRFSLPASLPQRRFEAVCDPSWSRLINWSVEAAGVCRMRTGRWALERHVIIICPDNNTYANPQKRLCWYRCDV